MVTLSLADHISKLLSLLDNCLAEHSITNVEYLDSKNQILSDIAEYFSNH
jgi:predicted Zn-dependent peptidase